jgi:hypothetical protein
VTAAELSVTARKPARPSSRAAVVSDRTKSAARAGHRDVGGVDGHDAAFGEGAVDRHRPVEAGEDLVVGVDAEVGDPLVACEPSARNAPAISTSSARSR